jgi:DNA repair protein RadD
VSNWPHQDRAKERIREARLRGVGAVIAAAPCGAGKSRVMQQLACEEVENGGSVRIYLHRTMLKEQLSATFTAAGIDHGIMAAGNEYEESKPIQICMTDSVFARAIRGSKWDLGNPSLVMFDEAHLQAKNKAISIVKGGTTGFNSTWEGHQQRGAFILGLSATPVGCGALYDEMIDFGTYSEMRSVRAHLPVRVYSPSEIDCSGLKQDIDNEFSSKQLEPRAYKIFGDAYGNWRKLNPDSLPAILFAPSVPASRWFAEEWAKMGVPVAHIDGETCLLPSRSSTGAIKMETYDTTQETRQQIMDMSRTGEIKVVMNRFILREAIDMPWLYHGIAATVFGGIATYLQSVGRIQRYYPEYQYKIWQSHGGCYWRHGSPNMDREWELGCTNKSIAQGRASKIARAERPQDVEGICCPKCSVWRQYGQRCPGCGHSHAQSVRSVQMVSGELKLMRGIVNKGKKKGKKKTANQLWVSCLFAMSRSGKPVSSAVSVWRARCAKEGVYPDVKELRFKPPEVHSIDWHKLVSDVFPWTRKRVS